MTWNRTTIKQSSYLKGRIGWQGLRASEFTSDGPYLITGTDFKEDGTINWTSCYHVGMQRYEQASNIHVKNGDLLITKDGTIGKVAYVLGCPEKAVLNSGVFLLRCSDESYDHKFMFHLLRSPIFDEFLRVNLAGSTIHHLYQHIFEGFEFPVPVINEQRSMAKVLDIADENIAKTESLIAKLKAINQGIMHDLLTYGIDESGKLRNPEEYPEQFRKTLLGKIPQDWDTPTIGELAIYIGSGITPLGGSNVYRKDGVLFIRSQNVTFEGLQLDDVAYISDQIHSMMARSEVFAHDVLLNITGASIGRCCPMPTGLGTANVNQHVCAIRITKPRWEDALFLSSIMASYIGQRQISILNAGSNRQGLNYQQLRSFVIPWPRSNEERIAIAKKIREFNLRINKEEANLLKLKSIKRGLIQDLLTGKVRVS